MHSIGDAEREQISELRDAVVNLAHPNFDHDYNYLRALEKCNFNVKKAGEELRCHLLVRRALELDTLSDAALRRRVSPLHREHMPGTQYPVRPVVRNADGDFFLWLGYFNRHSAVSGMQAHLSSLDFFTSMLYEIESQARVIRSYERATGKRSGNVMVVDAEDYVFELSALWNLRRALDFMLSNFGNMTAKLLLVNLPAWATGLWALYKKIFTSQLCIDLVKVEELPRHLDMSCLPPKLGGILTDPCDPSDVYCSSIFNVLRGPPYEHLRPETPLPPLTTLRLRPSTVSWLHLRVQEPGSVVSVTVAGESVYSFGVYYAADERQLMEGDEAELLSAQVPCMDPASLPSRLSLTAAKAGVYGVRLGAEGGLFGRTTLHCAITATAPQRSEPQAPNLF